jgi:hypothetical protein
VAEVRVAEQGETEAVVVIEADQAPTFQVFGEGLSYTIELPGADLGRAKVKRPKGQLLVNTLKVDGASSRARLTFHGDVDYDARVHGRRLVVTFTHLGERATLEQLKSLREEVVRLRARKGKLDNESATSSKAAKAELARVEAEVQRLTKRKKLIDGEIEKRAKARASADKELAKLTSRKGDVERAVKKGETRRVELARSNAQLENKASATRAEVAALEKERKRQAELGQKAAARLKAIEADQAAKKTAFEKERKRLAAELAAEAKKIKIKESLAKLEKDITTKRAIVDKLNKQRAERAQAVADLEGKGRTLAAEVENLTQASSGLRKRVEQDRADADRATKTAADARAQANRAREEAKAATSKRDGLRRDVKTLSQRHADLQTKVASLTRQQGDATASVAALQREERSARRRLEQLKGDVKRMDRVARATPAPAPAPERRPSRIAVAAPQTHGFGGSKSIDLKRGPTNRYERASEFLDDEEIGRGALSRITVQARGESSRVGIRVDGGAQYNVRRGDGEIILTLFDTRAANLDVRRIVDARNLGTNVLRVLPKVEEGERSRVQLTIELRDANEKIRLGHDDAMLWLLVG